MNKVLRFAAEKDIFPIIHPQKPFLKSHICIFCRIVSSKYSHFIPASGNHPTPLRFAAARRIPLLTNGPDCCILILGTGPHRDIAKPVKAQDFDSCIRWFKSSYPCQRQAAAPRRAPHKSGVRFVLRPPVQCRQSAALFFRGTARSDLIQKHNSKPHKKPSIIRFSMAFAERNLIY